MPAPLGEDLAITVDAVRPGTTLRYHYGTGDALAVVTDKTDEHVAFAGDDCSGKFTHDQIDRMLADGRLQVVLG